MKRKLWQGLFLLSLLFAMLGNAAKAFTAQTNMMTIGIGQSVSLETDVSSVLWSSTNASVATVDSYGVVKGVGTGYAIMKGISQGDVGYVGVKVISKAGVQSVSVTPDTLTITKGATAKLTASVLPKTAAVRTGKWVSADESIATVSSAGVVTGVKAGSTVITAVASSGVTAKCAVTVTGRAVKSIKLSQKTAETSIGSAFTLVATVSPANADNAGLVWSSSNSSAVMVTQQGFVMALGAGKSVIRVQSIYYPTVYSLCTVTVKGIRITSIRLSPTAMTVKNGASVPIGCSVLPVNATNRNLVWKSSKPAIVSVNAETGVITAKGSGKAVITATATDGSKVSGTCTITVE